MSHRCHSSVTVESGDSDQELLLPGHHHSSDYLSRSTRPAVKRVLAVHGVPQRVMVSLVPPLVYPEYQRVYTDLKGPFLVVATLSAILLYGLHNPNQALTWKLLAAGKLTLGYWIVFSLLAFLLGHFCGTNLSLVQLVAMAGYSLSGHCLVLLGAEVLHQESHAVFFLLTAVFGGLATGRLVLLVLMHTPQPPQRLLVGSFLASIHLMHLIYVHFACMRRKFDV